MHLLKALQPLYNIRLEGGLNVYTKNTDTVSRNFGLTLAKISSSNVITTVQSLSSTTLAAGADSTHVTTFNVPPFNLATGDRLILHYYFTGHPAAGEMKWQLDMPLKITWRNTTPSFKCKALRSATVFKRIVEKITDGTATAVSTLLNDTTVSYVDGIDNRPWDTVLAPGSSIRSAKDSNGNPVSKLKINLKKFFKFTSTEWCTGMGLSGNVVSLEKRAAFYRSGVNDMIADLGEVDECEISHFSELPAAGLRRVERPR
jgi:hypothetical protein